MQKQPQSVILASSWFAPSPPLLRRNIGKQVLLSNNQR